MEGLVIELILGAPAVDVFPRLRELARAKLLDRLRGLKAQLLERKSASTRFPYKAAQLARIAASLECGDEPEPGDVATWPKNTNLSDWVERYL